MQGKAHLPVSAKAESALSDVMQLTYPPLVKLNGTTESSLIYLDEIRLSQVKQKIFAKDQYFLSAYKELLVDANKVLKIKADPVTNKNVTPPSGDKHDYLSVAPYWWPDPTKPDGLPWIRKDGEVNPQTRGNDTDQLRMSHFFESLNVLSLAFYFSEEKKYGDKLKDLINIWILSPSTKVKPNINFGQAVPGSNQGRPAGVIEWSGISQLVSAMQILERNNAIDMKFKLGVDKWLNQYLVWLTTSEIGVAEDNSKNNHGSWYDNQVIGISLYLGLVSEAIARVENAKTKRIAEQIEPDGSMPAELNRTKSVSYSSMNLKALTGIAALGQRLGLDLWNYQTPDGRSIKKAIAFLTPYAQRKKKWEWQQITPGGVDAALDKNLLPTLISVGIQFDESIIPIENKGYLKLVYRSRLVNPPLIMLNATSSAKLKTLKK